MECRKRSSSVLADGCDVAQVRRLNGAIEKFSPACLRKVHV